MPQSRTQVTLLQQCIVQCFTWLFNQKCRARTSYFWCSSSCDLPGKAIFFERTDSSQSWDA